MKTLLLVSAVVLAMSAAAVGVWVGTRSGSDADPKKSQTPVRGVSPHGAGIDEAHATVLAMYDAPEGATPCETAHNAFAAEAEAARSLGRESYFSFVADRAEFLAGCEELEPTTQRCLAPSYQARHREACKKALPEELTLPHLFRFDEPEVLAEDPHIRPE